MPERVGQSPLTCQRRQAVADVAGRRNSELSSQPTAGAAIVAHRHDRGHVAVRTVAQAGQEDRQPRPPPNATMRSGRASRCMAGKNMLLADVFASCTPRTGTVWFPLS